MSLLFAFLLSSPGPREVPEGVLQDCDPIYAAPFKIQLEDDEVVFVLRKERSDTLRPAFSRLEENPVKLPGDPTSAEVRLSPIGGVGVFATKDFSPGDLVLSERPMVSA
jgi:hypothetical protein